jgi:hypothetical protein
VNLLDLSIYRPWLGYAATVKAALLALTRQLALNWLQP